MSRTPAEGPPARRRETVGDAVARRAAEEARAAEGGRGARVRAGSPAGEAGRPTRGRGRAVPRGRTGTASPGSEGSAPRKGRDGRRRADPGRGAGDGAGGATRGSGQQAARAAERRPPSPLYRRRRRVAALVGGLVLLAGLAVGARVLVYDVGLFDVEGVAVTGASAVPQDDVLTAAAVVPGGPLASVDTAGIASRVAQLPGVGAVDVGLGWPHTVTIAVTERIPVAVTQTRQGPRPVDASGVVYPAPAPAGLPQLRFGPIGADDPSTRAALDVLGSLPDPLRAQVQTVEVAIGGGTPQVTLGLTERRQVRWGPAESAAEKASVLVALLTRPGRVYDVTSPELPTVRS